MARPHAEDGFEEATVKMPLEEAYAWTDPDEIEEMPLGACLYFSADAPIRNGGISITKLKSGYDVEDGHVGEGGKDAEEARVWLEDFLENLDENGHSTVTLHAGMDPDVDMTTGEWKDE